MVFLGGRVKEMFNCSGEFLAGLGCCRGGAVRYACPSQRELPLLLAIRFIC